MRAAPPQGMARYQAAAEIWANKHKDCDCLPHRHRTDSDDQGPVASRRALRNPSLTRSQAIRSTTYLADRWQDGGDLAVVVGRSTGGRPGERVNAAVIWVNEPDQF